ncbi:MAG: CcmD family protein [Bacteroidales bacterium]|jgi:CcmD family protein|nr:CcmD family protein [Bacteroidales bacterium]
MENKMFVVVAVMSLIFIGVFVYLLYLDRKTSKLEKYYKSQKKD